jgi:hypothetical protein
VAHVVLFLCQQALLFGTKSKRLGAKSSLYEHLALDTELLCLDLDGSACALHFLVVWYLFSST